MAGHLAGIPRSSTGLPLPVVGSSGHSVGITLTLSGVPSVLGDHSYQLDADPSGVAIRANRAAVLFAGVQSLRQLLPAAVESAHRVPPPWPVAGGHIMDKPRFAYRGAMRDLARHFFPISVVERYLDELALYKVNYFHLHLSDERGLRIAIGGLPRLESVGGGPWWLLHRGRLPHDRSVWRRALHHGPSRDRHFRPHQRRARPLHRLNWDGAARPPQTGTDVGFSSLGRESTYQFIDQVIGQLAALTPGPVHPGADYATVINRAKAIVAAHAKTVVRLARHGQRDSAAVNWGAVLGHQHERRGRCGRGEAPNAADPVARQPRVPGHQVHRGQPAGAGLGWAERCEAGVRLGPGA